LIYSPAEESYGQTANLIGGLAVMVAIPAILCFILAFNGDSVEMVPLMIGVAILVALGFLWNLIRKTELSIHAEGVRRVSAFGTQELAWDEIAEYRYQEIPIKAGGAVGGLIGMAIQAAYEAKTGKKAKSRVLTLQGRDKSKKIKVTSNFQNAEDAIQRIVNRLHDRRREGVRQRLDRYGQVKFGGLTLTRQGVSWNGKEEIPWSGILKIELAGRHLCIRKGKLFNTLSVVQGNVPDLLLAVEMMNALHGSAQMAPVVETFA